MINLKRDIYNHLLKWKNSKNRKPLILKGARQVGKTFILKEFGNKNYENVAYFNFEADKRLNDFFKVSLDAENIIKKLSIYSNTRIEPGTTLIIFDEVQESPETITSLKYFNEQANEYHVISSGSLLGLMLGQTTSAPVGKVTFMTLYPMSFGEFLDGIRESGLRKILLNKNNFTELESGFHEKLIEHLKIYFFIGGMPAAVAQYAENKDLKEVRQIQNDIISAYTMDFAKHTSKPEASKILNIWNSIPKILTKENKKFKYSEIEKNAKARKYRETIQRLIDIGIVYVSYNITKPKLPLSAYINDGFFKLFFLDTGLLGAMLDLSSKTIVERNKLFLHYNGAFTENYAAQELTAAGYDKLYYWTSGNTAEVDFILSFHENVYPFEIKSGFNTKAKSLKVYKEKYKPRIVARASLRNFSNTDNVYDYPLYAVSLFPLLR